MSISFRDIFRPSDGIFRRLPTIEGRRVVLRAIKMSDARDIYDYCSDDMVAKHVMWEAYDGMGDARSFVRFIQRLYKNDEPSSWGITLPGSNKVIGTVGFMWWNREYKAAEVGYSLSRDYWNRGIMTEALALILDFGFKRMSLNRIEAQHVDANAASGRVMEKCGMKKEGVLRSRIFSKGEFRDMVLYAILKSDPRPVIKKSYDV